MGEAGVGSDCVESGKERLPLFRRTRVGHLQVCFNASYCRK